MTTSMNDLVEALDAAVELELRRAVPVLSAGADGQRVHAVAIGMVDDPTGFFVAADTLENVAGRDPADSYLSYFLWAPSEWPVEFDDLDDELPVGSAARSGT